MWVKYLTVELHDLSSGFETYLVERESQLFESCPFLPHLHHDTHTCIHTYIHTYIDVLLKKAVSIYLPSMYRAS